MVIWLIGLSASGKTTIGKKLFEKLKSSNEKWIFLDGDTFRNIMGEDLGHNIEDREKNAYRISRFCEYMASQNVNVLACVLSIFHGNQKYNKMNISDYKEVYIDIDLENAIKRDNKKLYEKALEGKIKNVVGVDIEFNPPYSPDIVIDNDLDNPNYDEIAFEILTKLDISVNNKYEYTKDNLLENPQKYQYSKLEGSVFFEKIKRDREESILFFDERLEKLKFDGNCLLEKGKYKNKNSLFLKDFLIIIYLEGAKKFTEYNEVIDLLIKRFEVSKKLYSTYTINDIRKKSNNYKELLNYALFSLVLQERYKDISTEKRFVYLNTVLKLNDIISSVRSDFILENELYFAKLALEKEVEILKEIRC